MGAAASPPTETCNARTRAGSACKRQAGLGTDHRGYGRCKFHAGSTENGKIAAAKQRVAQLAGLDPISGPEAIERALAIQNGIVTEIGRLETEHGIIVDGKLHPYLRMLLDETRPLAQIAKLATEAHLDERRVQIEERQASLLEQLLVDVFDAAELTPAQEAAAHEVVERHLRLVEAAA